MDTLFERHSRQIAHTSLDFTRGLMDKINWNARLIGIRGARGIGKTTLLLQYIKKYLPGDLSVLYVSLDNIWCTENKLVDLADAFAKRGGQYLFLDEVHKYPDWSREIKNIYDDYPQLKVVFTGSSLLEILNARADLSRRAIVYEMQGLSFREYLNMTQKKNLSIYSLEEILENHLNISGKVLSELKPFQHFDTYLKIGYYPFFQEIPELYYTRLEEVINMILEIELPQLRGVDISYIPKIKQLLLITAESVPFIPNVTKLSERIGINRNTFTSYLRFLQETKLISLLYRDISGITKLQKPDKLYLDNTNLIYALSPDNANFGNVRETFFLNQFKYAHRIEYPEQGDFFVDEKYMFEIGGKSKTDRQISETKNAFVAYDGVEYGYGNRIPLWMFGFLY